MKILAPVLLFAAVCAAGSMSPVLAQVGVRPGVTRVITTGSSNTATAADNLGWIAWKSGTTGNKSQVLPACGPGNNGMSIGVIDQQGDAGTYPIAVTSSSMVGGLGGGVLISTNHGAATFVCDGQIPGNWNVMSQMSSGPTVRAYSGTTDTIRSSDNGGLVTYDNSSPVAVTLPHAGMPAFPPNGFSFAVQNYGAGAVTITPDPPSKIHNGLSNLLIDSGFGAFIFADEMGNYQSMYTGQPKPPTPLAPPTGWSLSDHGAGVAITTTTHNDDTATKSGGPAWGLARGTKGYVLGVEAGTRTFALKIVSTQGGPGWMGGISTSAASIESFPGSAAGGVGIQAGQDAVTVQSGFETYIDGAGASTVCAANNSAAVFAEGDTMWIAVQFNYGGQGALYCSRDCVSWLGPVVFTSPGQYFPAWAGGPVGTKVEIETQPNLSACAPGHVVWE